MIEGFQTYKPADTTNSHKAQLGDEKLLHLLQRIRADNSETHSSVFYLALCIAISSHIRENPSQILSKDIASLIEALVRDIKKEHLEQCQKLERESEPWHKAYDEEFGR